MGVVVEMCVKYPGVPLEIRGLMYDVPVCGDKQNRAPMPITLIQIRPPGCCIYKHFYNHARRLRLEKLLYIISRAP
jgi:hypothetical protein